MAGRKMTVDMMIKTQETMNDLHPDSLICVHTTKVVTNQIRTLMYYQYTDSKAIREGMERSIDPWKLEICSNPRSNVNKLATFLSLQPEPEPKHEREHLTHLLTTNEDVVVYGRVFMTLTLSEQTKKVTDLNMQCDYTSFRSANENI